MGTGLPKEAVNVLAEDPKQENVLYLGTDHGAYVSVDKGASFMPLGGGLPNVAVHDLVVHPRENELIVATHGRSVFIGDITAIQNLATLERKETFKVLSVEDVKFNKNWGDYKYGNQWYGFNEPSCSITFYSASAGKGQLKIMDGERTMAVKGFNVKAGLNIYDYDFSRTGDAAQDGTPAARNGKVYLEAGIYDLVLTNGIETLKTEFELKPE